MKAKSEFERAIESEVGEPVDSIRNTPIDERRRRNERKFKQRMRFVARHPLIGRGNVMRDRTVSRDEVEAQLDKALRE